METSNQQISIELQSVTNQNIPFIQTEKTDDSASKQQLFNDLFFFDVYPIIKLAQNTTLEVDMIRDLPNSKKSIILHQKFSSKLSKGEVEGKLIKTLIIFFLCPIVKVMFTLIVLSGCQLGMPLVIKSVIDFISRADRSGRDATYLILVIVFLRLIYIFSSAHSRKMILCIGYDAMSVINLEIMKKILKISLLSTKDWKSGEITNLIQVDAQKLILITRYIASVTMIPFQLGISLYMMYNMIGISFLIGCSILIIMIIFNIVIGKFVVKSQNKVLKDKDERTKKANEVFSLIKFIKINALEDHFLRKVKEARSNEVNSIKIRLYYAAISIFSVWLTPQLLLSTTFGLYVYLGHQLNPSTTFAIISLFQVLQYPLVQLPIAINSLIECKLSLSRIERFLLTKELMTDCIKQSEFHDPTAAIEVSNGIFYWNKLQQPNNATNNSFQQPILQNIQLCIKPGKFVSIIGDVGSGKTSLLQALLGEMIYQEGYGQPKIRLNGRIAYVSQKPWIQNATVKDNIIFGKMFNETQYEKAIYYSCLTQDLKNLINGDQTMIGEKGINLSGGQKARISLARAIYGDFDIILLDDPLSAVDTHVGTFIMKECLLQELKNTTRVLITHALNYCKYTDYIYLLDNGVIAEQGNYGSMLKSSKFQEIKQQFHCDQDEDADSEKNPQESSEPWSLNNLDDLSKDEVKSNPAKGLQDLAITKINDSLDEEKQSGNIAKEVIIQYFAHNGGGFSFCLVLIIMLAWIICYLGASIWISIWSGMSSNDKDFQENGSFFSIYFALGILQAFLVFIRTIMIIRQSIKSAEIVHDKMMNSLIHAPQCQFFERVPQGRIMNRLTKDINSLDTEIYWNISWLYTKISQLISNTFLNVYASTYLIIFPIIIFFLICFKVNRLYMKASRELQRLELISKSPILSYFTETLSGLTTIRAYQQAETFLNNFADKIDLNKKIYYLQVQANAQFLQIVGLSSLIVNISAIIYCIYYTENPAFAGLLMTYAANIDVNILQTVESLSLLENGIISFERCIAYTKIQPEKRNLDAIELKNWPQQGIIQFKNFSVQYREGLPPALKNMTFQINSTEKIGIVGRTGAGKSSITLSLLRILESLEGQILIDGIDISQLSLKQLRESITIILQDSVIFNTTIRENLDPKGQCTDEEILQVVEECCLNRITSNREGLQTKIHEGGDNLSAGERQLICIARAILRKSKIILIDEATANIDVDTEHKIQQVIQKAFKNCTVITIAHRINTILYCDKVMILDQGSVIEFGDTQTLKNDKTSTFYSIYQEVHKNQIN